MRSGQDFKQKERRKRLLKSTRTQDGYNKRQIGQEQAQKGNLFILLSVRLCHANLHCGEGVVVSAYFINPNQLLMQNRDGIPNH